MPVKVFGTIPNVKAKGTAAVACLHRAMRMRREETGAETGGEGGEFGGGGISSVPGIDTLILLDRCVYIAPCFMSLVVVVRCCLFLLLLFVVAVVSCCCCSYLLLLLSLSLQLLSVGFVAVGGCGGCGSRGGDGVCGPLFAGGHACCCAVRARAAVGGRPLLQARAPIHVLR